MSKKDKKNKFRDNLIARSEEARIVPKIVLIALIAFTLIFTIGAISGYLYVKSALEPVDPNNKEDIVVEIPIGSSTSAISSILEEKDIIKNSLIFRFYTKFKNESNFQAGEYTFNQSMTIDEIIESLKTGRVIKDPIYKVTIPEGKTVDEIAEIFSEKVPIEKDAFLEKVNDTAYINVLIKTFPDILTEEILDPNIRTPLEGYLFAATYNIYEEEPTIESIVEEMLEKSVEVINNYRDGMEEKQLTVHEAVTMASLVEKESGSEEQRDKIASIFYNRLEEGMRLQTDPTVLYALGEHKGKVLLKDLEVESPYNTYQIDGIPVGPISNFSESSFEAIINPEDTNYRYFLHDEEGNIYYAETHEEHLQLKQQHIR